MGIKNDSQKKIKVNLLTPRRFHLVDLARELQKEGYDIKIYSYVPAKRIERFGVKRKYIQSVFWLMVPILVAEKVAKKLQLKEPWCQWINGLGVRINDFFTTHRMRKCDVLISMTGSYIKAVQRAQKSGALIIYERGSKHILEQKRILEECAPKGVCPISEFNIKRELNSYEIANYISVPSGHARDSFLIYGFPEEKLFLNPYGVNLDDFYPIPDIPKKYDVITVGNWSRQKGSDILIEALKETDLKFLHVGSIRDVDFPKYTNFTHIDAVDEKELIKYYNQSKIFVLASRQDGFGMVLSQAIACGLPLVCTKDTGGADLKRLLGDNQYIVVIKQTNATELRNGIYEALKLYETLPIDHDYIGKNKKELSWEAYGKRYSNFLDTIVENKQE